MAHLMVGHVTDTSARIWVRGKSTKAKEARLRYRASGSTAWKTETRPLLRHRGYIEVIELADLSPATSYELSLSYDAGGPPPVSRGGFTTAPEGAAAITFLVGSCSITRGFITWVKNPKTAWEGVASIVEQEKPQFMIHCGDQIYADLPGKPPEFMHLRTYREIYEKSWAIPGQRKVFAELPNYMILDDHEIFDNYYCGKTYVGASSQPIRDAALVAYGEFQHSHNPQSFPHPAFYYRFEWGGAAFMALDTRTEREKGVHPQMIGSVQMSALKNWLLANRDRPKFVVTSIPFVGQIRSGDDTWSGPSFRAQRDEIVDFLSNHGIGRLVFLTGDQHRSYHATMTIPRAVGDLVIHELMSSPINQVTGGIGSFLLDAELATGGGTPYRIRLDPAEFYGEHSNVMKLTLSPAGTLGWSLFRTKRTTTPVLAGTFDL